MQFNSIEFTIFLSIIFGLYWLVLSKSLKIQNLLLLAASYIFYGWWDWRFLSLIIFSSFVDYWVGIGLGRREGSHRKTLLLISIFVNIGLLIIFKYFNFFTANFIKIFSLFGAKVNLTTLNIILPIGISFYTFQTLSYTIDVYKKKCKPTKDIIAFFAFVSFFPQLVAGPIERATNLLVQFNKKRVFRYDKTADGMRQILWGLFKKIVIADNCAVYVNYIFAKYTECSGMVLLLGAVFFAFQIYGDFSGYSDIAIGTAKLFGFNLTKNFAFPYFSRDIAEFWRRWHISLSSWFRDYIYIPLGGSRGGIWLKIRNIVILFLISGLWHGASWTFITWGALNAVYFLPLFLLKKNRKHLNIVAQGKVFPSVKELSQIGVTFFITTVAWVFFRAESVRQAFDYLIRMITGLFYKAGEALPYVKSKITLFILIFVIIEWLQRDKEHALQIEALKIPKAFRWLIYYVLIATIFMFTGKQQEFIYFQF